MKEHNRKSVLVVDDEPGMRMALQSSFQRDGWSVETASCGTEALKKLGVADFPLLITDVRMPHGDGLELMRSVRSSKPSTAVILLTAFGNVPEAVQAMRGGACDYLTKPVSFEDLKLTVERVMQFDYSVTEESSPDDCPIVGASPSLRKALERARHAARTGADVLIEAESGTGKELVARYIHEHSERSEKPFVAVNCAAVPENLLESELFGHVRGAFTGATGSRAGKFELAEGGTLLLDEIGDMPLHLQPKLLRALQEREFERLGDTRTTRVNIRIVATTNLPLSAMVAQGRFRADLYYRLNVIPMTLPPLRDRRGDIPALAEFFARKIAVESGRPKPALNADFLAALQEYTWPGNVREFANVMRRVLALNEGHELTGASLRSELLQASASTGLRSVAPAGIRAGTPMREVERRLLEQTLEITGGNRTRTAELLGVSLRTIRNKIREFGLPPRRYA